MTNKKRNIAILLGDPSGIGPELVSKLLSQNELDQANIIVIGEKNILENGNKITGNSHNLNLVNKFEEINFKIDKLSSRISKNQADSQLRFQDLEKARLSGRLQSTDIVSDQSEKQLPGSSEAQDLGRISDEALENTQIVQSTQSVESTSAVVTETYISEEKILPEGTPKEQYDFALSFVKVGDYETAEIALKEFVDTNAKDELAGSAQYWYAETFRIRQLYQDAATAYLDGYQKYPNSTKAPVNLLKLGVSLVQIGEKDQGCSMITGVSKQYPKASQSVLQKAKYEEKKFDCPTKKS